MNVVIPYRQSYSNELRYTLRSLKNIPHKDVFIIGHRTRFKVFHIPYVQTSDIANNTLNILNMAVEEKDISNDFIWMADDIITLNPIQEIPIHFRGYYSDIIESYNGRRHNNYYVQRMKTTQKKLISLGIKNPKCYELHIPFVINKEKWQEVSKYITPEVNKLSMYANLHNIGGTQMKDVKVATQDTIPDSNFISTLDSTFGVNKAGKMIMEMFSEKGQYEYH